MNTLALRWRDETTQHLDERWMLRPGQNVLPPVRFEDPGVQRLLLRLTQGAPTRGSTIVGIGLGLGLEDAVDGPHQLDKFIDGLIPLRRVLPSRRGASTPTHPEWRAGSPLSNETETHL